MNPIKTIRDHAKSQNVDDNLLLSAVNKIRPGASLYHVVGSDVINKAFSMLSSGAEHITGNGYQETTFNKEVNHMTNSTDPDSVERHAQQVWDSSADIRAEFGRFSTYNAYCQYEARKAQRQETQKLNNDKHVDLNKLEKEISQDWDSSADIRSEFGKFSTYSAYRLAEAKGFIRICGNANKRG